MRRSAHDVAAQPQPGVTFQLLGPVECTADGTVVAIGHPRQRCVLAVLLVEANRSVHTEQLIDRVWGEKPPNNVRNVLSSYVTRLRGAFNLIGGDQVTLGRRSGGYSLVTDPERIDMHRFRDLVAAGRPDGPRAEIVLSEALALWHGPAFAGLESPWLTNLRQTLEHERLLARLRRNDIVLDTGRHAELLPELHELIAEYPLDERVATQYMLALYRSGRQADALAVCMRAKTQLAEELGLDPGPELGLLEARILRNDPDLLLPPAIGQTSRQPTVLLSVPHELPAGIADFTGRDHELTELDAGLDHKAGPGASAIVISALDGMAGVGKTALAVHWAHRVKDRFPDGQLFVDLRGHARGTPSDPLRVLARFLRALGVPPERVPLDPDEAVAMYRTVLSGRRALVVLDNARGPEQVRPLLPGAASCVTVVTSRNQLGGLVARDGAQQFTLGILTEESARELVIRIVGERRVRAEPQAVTELLRLCAHLPLALRIAAANLAGTPDERIADHVSKLRTGNRLDLLQVPDDPDTVVRSAFTLSYTGLDDEARRLFRCIGVVPGAIFGAATVAALIDRPVSEALVPLGALTAAHLVELDGDHYRCHDLLRLYARERLTTEESATRQDEIMARLHEFYLRSVAAAADLLYPQMLRLPDEAPATNVVSMTFDDPGEALGWLDEELANMLAVIAHGEPDGQRRVAWRLADLLRGYFWLRRCTADWISAADDARRAAEAEGDRMAAASAWLSSGGAYWTISHLVVAIEHHHTALALAKEVGWVDGEAAALGNLASVYLESGELDRAESAYTTSLDLHTRHGRQSGRAIDMNNLGNLYWEMGALSRAERYLTEALAILDTTDAPVPKANALLNLGCVQHDTGNLATALETLRQALALCRTLGSGADEATALELIARVYLDSGRLGEALAEGQAALTLAQDISVHRIEAAALLTLGTVHHHLGHTGDAIKHHEQALSIGGAIDDRRAVTEALTGMAVARMATNDLARALDHVEEAVRVAEQAGYRLLVGRALTVRGRIHRRRGDLSTARDQTEKALDIQLDSGDRLWAARSAELLSEIHDRLGDPTTADHLRHTAHTMRHRIGVPCAPPSS